MATDKLILHPMWLGEDLSVVSPRNVIESVPVSQYKPYLEATYGAGALADEDKKTADLFFDAGTAYSTDESLGEIICDPKSSPDEKAKLYIARWLQLAIPLADSATELRKLSVEKLASYDSGDLPTEYDYGLSYVSAAFYANTQVLSSALDIPHPSETHPGIVAARTSRELPIAVTNRNSVTLKLARSLMVAADQRRTVELLASKTVVLNRRAMKAAEKSIAITQAIQARLELKTLLGE